MSDALSPTRWWKGLLLLMLVAAWWRALHGGGVALGAVWTAATLVVWLLIDGRQRRARQGFIESSPMPRHLRREVFARYPSLTERQFDDIERGLRQFFICHLRARRFVSMVARLHPRHPGLRPLLRAGLRPLPASQPGADTGA